VQIHLSPVEDFQALGRMWRQLEPEVAGHGFFQSWSWVGCLAEARYPDPVLLRAEQDGRLLGLALFNRRGDRLYLAESGNAGLDAPFIEHNAPLAPPAIGAALLRAAWGLRGVRRLVLSGVAAEAPFGTAWRAQRREAPFADLNALRAAGGGALSLCSANARQQIRRSDRSYAARGPLTLTCLADPLAGFAAMLPLHERSWAARGKPGAFASEWMRRFHGALIRTAQPRGEVELLRIDAGDHEIGYLYNFRHGGRVHAYQSGFDLAGAQRHEKPGLTSHSLAIGRALAAGDSVYDFLAGADRYKLSLSQGSQDLWWVELVRPWSWRGVAARLRAGWR
jgi:CelD/BcsL family acetyltransferase involved in cellulose biosynthesis